MTDDCLVCSRIEMISEGVNPYFVRELESGYVVIGDFQTYEGYTLFLSKVHASELHKLEKVFRGKFLSEMAVVAEAVFKAFKPDKMNYELLGNTDEHMHWHLFPRRKSDLKAYTAIWAVEKVSRSKKPTIKEIGDLKRKLENELSKLLD